MSCNPAKLSVLLILISILFGNVKATRLQTCQLYVQWDIICCTSFSDLTLFYEPIKLLVYLAVCLEICDSAFVIEKLLLMCSAAIA